MGKIFSEEIYKQKIYNQTISIQNLRAKNFNKNPMAPAEPGVEINPFTNINLEKKKF